MMKLNIKSLNISVVLSNFRYLKFGLILKQFLHISQNKLSISEILNESPASGWVTQFYPNQTQLKSG